MSISEVITKFIQGKGTRPLDKSYFDALGLIGRKFTPSDKLSELMRRICIEMTTQ